MDSSMPTKGITHRRLRFLPSICGAPWWEELSLSSWVTVTASVLFSVFAATPWVSALRPEKLRLRVIVSDSSRAVRINFFILIIPIGYFSRFPEKAIMDFSRFIMHQSSHSFKKNLALHWNPGRYCCCRSSGKSRL
jgi:hypothetical protein